MNPNKAATKNGKAGDRARIERNRRKKNANSNSKETTPVHTGHKQNREDSTIAENSKGEDGNKISTTFMEHESKNEHKKTEEDSPTVSNSQEKNEKPTDIKAGPSTENQQKETAHRTKRIKLTKKDTPDNKSNHMKKPGPNQQETRQRGKKKTQNSHIPGTAKTAASSHEKRSQGNHAETENHTSKHLKEQGKTTHLRKGINNRRQGKKRDEQKQPKQKKPKNDKKKDCINHNKMSPEKRKKKPKGNAEKKDRKRGTSQTQQHHK